MGAWMSHYDEYGRFQQCRYYVGDWNGDATVSYTHLKDRSNHWSSGYDLAYGIYHRAYAVGK